MLAPPMMLRARLTHWDPRAHTGWAVLLAVMASGLAGCDIGLEAVQFDCGPLQAPAPGGGCQRVGVPEASCTVRPDGRGGCEMAADELPTPLNPSAPPCPATDPRHPHFPIKKTCEVDGITLGSDTPIYVDPSYTGWPTDGTVDHPFTRIGDALALGEVPLVLLAKGSYTENLVVRGNTYLCGVCGVDATVLRGDPEEPTLPALTLEPGDPEDPESFLPIIRFVTVDAARNGIQVEGWSDGPGTVSKTGALLYDMRVRAKGYGVRADKAGLRLKRSVIEHAEGVAIDVTRSKIEVVDSAVQATEMKDGQGRAVAAHPGEGELEISSSFIDAQPEVGVLVDGTQVTIEDTLIRGAPPGEGSEGGPGIVVKRASGPGSDAALTLRSSVVEGSRDVASRS